MRTASIFVALAALARFAVATPPACLIAAVGVQSNPADTKTLCGTGKQWVIGNITEACEGSAETKSFKIYKDTCLEIEGVTISLPTATSTSTSPSKTGSATKVTSTSTDAAASFDEDDDEEAVWVNGSATNSTGSGNSTGTGANSTGTGADSPQSTGAGSSLSASSSVFLGSVIAIAGLASQFL